MRQLYPTKDNKIPTLNKLDSFKLTEEQYNAILEALANLNTAIQNTDDDLEQYKSLLRESITSTLASFDNLDVATKATIADAVISTIKSNSADITNITSEQIETAIINSTQAVFNTARIDNLTATEAAIDTVTGETATFTQINATNANIDNYSIENGNIDNLSADTANIEEATVTDLTATNADVASATVSEATVTDLTATEAHVDDLYSEKIYNHYFNHNQEFNKQVVTDDSISADGDYYIVLPKFRNGTYYLIAKNGENGQYLWSMEIVNSVKNITFSWSVNSEFTYLQDVEVIEDSTDETQFIQIHCKTNSLATHIWHQCTDYNTQTPPSIYATKQYDGTQEFEITQQKGNYMPNAVFVGDFHAEHLIIDDIQFDKVTVLKQIALASGYDAYGEPLGTTTGLPNQYIRNIEVNGEIRTQWTSPADAVERDNDKLITSDAVSEFNGQVDLGEDPLDPTQHVYDYPIKHLGDGTVVHGKETADKVEVTEEAKLPNLFNGKEADFDATEYASDSIVIFTEVNDPSDYAANKLYRLRKTLTDNYLEEIVATSTLTDKKPVVYDADTNTFKTADELDISDIKADNIIVDDLTVNGTAHINNTEEETVVGNFVTLRTNNQAGLTPGEYSGLLVNNFKVGEICAIVVDSNGIARVGHATGTETTYTDLYYTNDKYYTDAELTTEVTPAGVMISWDDKEVVDGVEHWTNAVWKVLNFDSTQALLTRKEDVDMNDKGILAYDKTSHRSETIALPTKDEQTLEAHVVEAHDEEGLFLFPYGTSIEVDSNGDPTGVTRDDLEEEGWTYSRDLNLRSYYTNAEFDNGETYSYVVKVENIAGYTTVEPGYYRLESLNLSLAAIQSATKIDATFVSGTTFSILYDTYGYKSQWYDRRFTREIEAEVSYRWKDKQAGSYVYATMADYEADAANVPVGSQIIIEDEKNYLRGDDQ